LVPFDKEYYEHDEKWNPNYIREQDLQRVERVLQLIPKNTSSLLDVGCGNGILCNNVKSYLPGIKRVVGFERSEEAIKYVNTEKKIGDISELPFKESEIDTVCALEVLEHLPQQVYKLALKEISRVTKKVIIITVPNNEELSKSYIICPKCKFKFHPNYHMRSFNSKNLKNLFKNYGYKCMHIEQLGKKITRFQWDKVEHFLKFFFASQKKETGIGKSLCPKCGFSQRKNLKKIIDNNFKNPPHPNPVIELVWPKVIQYRWLLAVYEK